MLRRAFNLSGLEGGAGAGGGGGGGGGGGAGAGGGLVSACSFFWSSSTGHVRNIQLQNTHGSKNRKLLQPRFRGTKGSTLTEDFITLTVAHSVMTHSILTIPNILSPV